MTGEKVGDHSVQFFSAAATAITLLCCSPPQTFVLCVYAKFKITSDRDEVRVAHAKQMVAGGGRRQRAAVVVIPLAAMQQAAVPAAPAVAVQSRR